MLAVYTGLSSARELTEMKQYPSIPHVEDVSSQRFEEGHLWLLEKVDGASFRFQLQQSGLIRFGDRNRRYDDPDAVPEPYQHAVRHVREKLDREALRSAVDNVEDVVFFGEAMHKQTIEYDWERTPSFLGFDIWADDRETFYPLDTVERIFDRLGLESVNVFERERRARDFDPDSYAVPQSNWYDGPAEGVIIRRKQGQRTQLLHPAFREDKGEETAPVDISAAEFAANYATRHRFERIAAALEDRGYPVNFETLYDRVLEDIARETHAQLSHGSSTVEIETFRSEVGALTRQYLNTRDGETQSE